MDYVVGRNAVMELMQSDKGVQKLYVLKGDRQGSIVKILALAHEQGVLVQEVSRQKLDQMAEGLNHQGVCAIANAYRYYEIEDILEDARSKGQPPFVVVLDQIEDPQNLGAIIRTAEGAGAHGIIIPKRRAAQVTTSVHKASAGAASYMKVAMVTNLSRAIQELKQEGLWVFGAAGEADTFYWNQDLTGAVALVIGNEGKGISQNIRKHCDGLLSLPMFGKVTSLNASNAAAILIYEVVRARHGKA